MFLSTLFLIYSSCSAPASPWITRSIETSSLTCNRVVYPVKNRFRDLEVVFQQNDIFLNVYATFLEKDDEGNIKVIVAIDDTATYFQAPVLSGNHRISLPQEAKDLILNSLNEKKKVVITAGKYSSCL